MFSDMQTDAVDLIKKSGIEHHAIGATVSKKGIVIEAGHLQIETGDLIQRKMSNGIKETYEVIDPGFHEHFHGIPAHYQLEVKKLGVPEAAKAIQQITYNISGPNARINQHSIDNSTNIVNVDSKAFELLIKLRSEVEALALPISGKDDAMAVIDAVQHQIESGKAKKSIVATLLNSLPQAANIATIISALLPLINP